VFAAMQLYDADYAMVVTNSRYTVAAQTLATKIGVELTTAGDYLRRIEQLLV
jgi:HJR/Mrr/RecB family endonuclease